MVSTMLRIAGMLRSSITTFSEIPAACSRESIKRRIALPASNPTTLCSSNEEARTDFCPASGFPAPAIKTMRSRISGMTSNSGACTGSVTMPRSRRPSATASCTSRLPASLTTKRKSPKSFRKDESADGNR